MKCPDPRSAVSPTYDTRRSSQPQQHPLAGSRDIRRHLTILHLSRKRRIEFFSSVSLLFPVWIEGRPDAWVRLSRIPSTSLRCYSRRGQAGGPTVSNHSKGHCHPCYSSQPEMPAVCQISSQRRGSANPNNAKIALAKRPSGDREADLGFRDPACETLRRAYRLLRSLKGLSI
jgi:hypothetical protein